MGSYRDQPILPFQASHLPCGAGREVERGEMEGEGEGKGKGLRCRKEIGVLKRIQLDRGRTAKWIGSQPVPGKGYRPQPATAPLK